MAEMAPLQRFVAPGLEDLHPIIRDVWRRDFGGLDIAREIEGNARLAPRILGQLLGRLHQPLVVEALPAEDAPLIDWIMREGTARPALMLGCVWHRPTLLAWLTWGDGPDWVQQLNIDHLRLAFESISTDLRASAKAPKAPVDGLDHARVLSAGQDILGAWRHSLDVTLDRRLMMLLGKDANLSKPSENAPLAQILRRVAQALQEAQT